MAALSLLAYDEPNDASAFDECFALMLTVCTKTVDGNVGHSRSVISNVAQSLGINMMTIIELYDNHEKLTLKMNETTGINMLPSFILEKDHVGLALPCAVETDKGVWKKNSSFSWRQLCQVLNHIIHDKSHSILKVVTQPIIRQKKASNKAKRAEETLLNFKMENPEMDKRRVRVQGEKIKVGMNIWEQRKMFSLLCTKLDPENLPKYDKTDTDVFLYIGLIKSSEQEHPLMANYDFETPIPKSQSALFAMHALYRKDSPYWEEGESNFELVPTYRVLNSEETKLKLETLARQSA